MKKDRNVNPVQEHHSCHNYTAASGFGNDCENGRENMRSMENGSFMITVSWYILLFKCKNHIFSSCIPILLHLYWPLSFTWNETCKRRIVQIVIFSLAFDAVIMTVWFRKSLNVYPFSGCYFSTITLRSGVIPNHNFSTVQSVQYNSFLMLKILLTFSLFWRGGGSHVW